MTNAELLAKIKAEIESLKADYKSETDAEMVCGVACYALDQLLSFLDTLEEPKKDYNQLYKDIAESEWFKKSYVGKSLGDVIPVEEPVCEELRGEIEKCWKDWLSPSNQPSVEGVLPKSEFMMYARHFAKWGAEHLKK